MSARERLLLELGATPATAPQRTPPQTVRLRGADGRRRAPPAGAPNTTPQVVRGLPPVLSGIHAAKSCAQMGAWTYALKHGYGANEGIFDVPCVKRGAPPYGGCSMLRAVGELTGVLCCMLTVLLLAT